MQIANRNGCVHMWERLQLVESIREGNKFKDNNKISNLYYVFIGFLNNWPGLIDAPVAKVDLAKRYKI